MRFAFIDFESYWDSEYTLKKLSPGQYASDDRFQFVSVSVRIDENGQRGKTLCVFGEPAIRALLKKVDIESCVCVAHNMNGFDALLMVWKLGLHPVMFACTLSMARPAYSKLTNLGLGALVKFLSAKGVPDLVPKDSKVLDETKGMRLEQFSRDQLIRMAKYNCEDTDNCAAIFYHLLPQFSASELFLMDMTIRARAYPELELDIPLLEEALVREKASKREELLELAEAIGVSGGNVDAVFEAVRARLSSTPKFVALLESLGVEVPYKQSPKNAKKLIPALAKTDEGFLELMDSDDEVVVAAAQARLSVKSTLLETRIVKLVTARRTSIALPIPLRMWGADTTWRWSGEEYNPQNFTRINKRKAKNSDALRQSIVAPDGYVIGVADQSSIELRVNHSLWGVQRSIALYNQNAKADLYRDFASERHKKKPEDVTEEERQGGKVSHLGLGFGAGPPTFRRVAKVQFGLSLTEEESVDITYGWRDTYFQIPQGWNLCQESIPYMAEGTERAIDPGGLCHTCKDGIVLPSGDHIIRYPNLRQMLVEDPRTKRDKWEWVYGEGRHTRRLYGPKMTENMVQAIARDSVAVAAIEFYRKTKLRWKMMTHDELIYLFRVEEAEALLAELQATMRTRLKWWPQLVLWSEGGIARRYSDAK